MSYNRILPNGYFHAEISKNYISIQSKTFQTQKQAEQWDTCVEKNIETILSIKPSHTEKILNMIYTVGAIKDFGSIKQKSNNNLLRTKSVLSSIFQYRIEKNLDKNVTEKIGIKAEPN